MVDTFFGNESFDADDAVDQMLTNLVQNRQDLQPIVDQVASTFGAAISANDKQLTDVCKRCKTDLTKSINLIAQDIADITSRLEATLSISTAELEATIGSLWSEMFVHLNDLGLGGLPDMPPGGLVPGTLPPTAIPPGGFVPGIGGVPLPPGALPPMPSPGSVPPGSAPPYPGSVPGTLPPVRMQPPPGTVPMPSVPPGSAPPYPSPAPGSLPPYPIPAPGSVPPYPMPAPGTLPPVPVSPPGTVPPAPMPQPIPPGYVPPAPQPQPIPKDYLPPVPYGQPGYVPPLPGSVPPLPMPLPPVGAVPPGANQPPGTTVIPVPGGGGIVNVFVQPCCPEAPVVNVGGAGDDRPDDTQPPKKTPNVRVKGEADDRADDVEAGKCRFGQVLVPLPTPGSPQWCRMEPQIRQQLAAIGLSIIEWAGNALKDTAAWVDTPVQLELPNIPIGGGALVAALNGLLTSLKAKAMPALQFLWDYYCGLTRGLKVQGQCDVPTLLGLYSVKAAIQLLKQFRFGWDGFVWATVDLAFEVPPIAAAIEYICDASCPYRIPEVAEADEAWLHATIDDETYRCWIRAHGVDPEVHTPVLLAKRENATTEQIIEYGRRVGWDDATIRQALRFIGWVNDTEAGVQQYLYDELPTISDHLHWLQRNVFDDDYVKDYDLMNGFKDRFWKKFGADLRAQGMKEEYAALHYAAHWINPAPGQLFEMLRRLRPGRVDKKLEFKEEDLMRLLAEQDVAPYFRERFRAIAYQPFGLRFLRQLYDTRQIDDAELSERLQDISYNKADADTLVKSESIRRARTTATGTRGFTVPTIKALYLANKIRQEEVVTRMEPLGYPRSVALDAIKAWNATAALKHDDAGAKSARNELLRGVKEGLIVGVVSQDQAVTVLSANGYSQDSAKAYVTAVVSNDRVALTKKGILQIRKGVLSGRLALEASRPLLLHLGITEDKAQEYINVWQYDLEAGKKVLSQSQIIRAATDGLISLPVARQRLLNLGYDDADALLLTAEAQMAIASAEKKVLDAADKQRQVQAKAIAAAIKQNNAQLERFRKQLYALGTPKQIGTWYKDGLVGAAWVRERLTLMGFIHGDIDLMVLEWDKEASDAAQKKQKASAGNGQASGGSAS